jgi:hypothetical protein
MAKKSRYTYKGLIITVKQCEAMYQILCNHSRLQITALQYASSGLALVRKGLAVYDEDYGDLFLTKKGFKYFQKRPDWLKERYPTKESFFYLWGSPNRMSGDKYDSVVRKRKQQ